MKDTIRKILKEYYKSNSTTEPKWTDVYLDDTGHYNPDKVTYINRVLDRIKKETIFYEHIPLNPEDGQKQFTTPWGEDGFFKDYEDSTENTVYGLENAAVPLKWGDMYALNENERYWITDRYREWLEDYNRERMDRFWAEHHARTERERRR